MGRIAEWNEEWNDMGAAVGSPSLRDPHATTEVAENEAAIPPRALRVLIADSDASLLENCRRFVTHAGHACDTLNTADGVRDAIARGKHDMAFLHEGLLGDETEAILRMSRDASSGSLVVLTSNQVSAERCRAALAMGAWDFLPKPFSSGQLTTLLGRASFQVEQTRTVRLGTEESGVLLKNGLTIMGVSPQIRSALEKALRVAPTDAPVLLTGESGTGKELFARLIHEKSRRVGNRFVPLNCSALPGELLESELFGHMRGAFTGAVRDKVGILEAAHRGTVFLDEVGEMPVDLQAKLLRVIEDGSIRRVGSEEAHRKADFRIISATNRDPGDAMDAGRLRKDLVYRLGVVTIRLAPLRERPDDTLVLARHLTPILWQQYRPSAGPPPTLSDDALDALQSHPWPGNVRELTNVIGHAVIFGSPGHEIQAGDLPLDAMTGGNGSWTGGGEPQDSGRPLDLHRSYHEAKDRTLARFERAYLSRLIARTEGNLCEASRQAEINRTTLYRLMEKHELSREDLVGEADS
jgi:DNA-binding NtrC family response regulator